MENENKKQNEALKIDDGENNLGGYVVLQMEIRTPNFIIFCLDTDF